MNCSYFWLTKSSKSHGPGKIALKIIASSLNPQPPPSPVRIFNAHKLDFLNANFDGPEGYCFAASGFGTAYAAISTQLAIYDS